MKLESLDWKHACESHDQAKLECLVTIIIYLSLSLSLSLEYIQCNKKGYNPYKLWRLTWIRVHLIQSEAAITFLILYYTSATLTIFDEKVGISHVVQIVQ